MKKNYTLLLACCLLLSMKVYAQPSSPANVAREAEYDVKFYFLDLDIEHTSSFVSGNVLISGAVLASATDTFSVELDNTAFTIDSATSSLNGGAFKKGQVVTANTDVSVIMPFTAHANDMVGTRVYYHGTARTSTNFPNGAAFFTGNPVFSASPPYNAMSWWPCKQSLTDKADSSWFFITTDSANTAVSNGLLTDTITVAPGKKQWQWKSHHAIDFYLVSFVVGTVTKTIQYFHPPQAEEPDSMIVEYYSFTPNPDTLVLNILQEYSSHFGLYPFYDEKFGVATVNLSGGMENQTCVSLGVAGSVVWHETMHQWFGDNVTCGSYKDLCMNEGFARWAESLYPELTSATPNTTRIGICNQYESGALAYPDGSIYSYNTDTADVLALYAGEGYDMNYDKGAMMINSMRFEVNNDSLFFLGLRNYQAQFAGKTALGSDLRDVMTTTTGINFTDFFNQWYYGYGYPTFNIRWNQENNQLVMQIIEKTSDSLHTPLFKTSLELNVLRKNGNTNTDTVIRLFISQNVTLLNIPMGDAVTGFTVDPNQWILNGTGTVTHDVTTGILSFAANNNLTLYPNPCSGSFIIKGENNIADIKIYNVLGKLEYADKYYKQGENIDVSALNEGIYFVYISDLKSQGVFKLLIEK